MFTRRHNPIEHDGRTFHTSGTVTAVIKEARFHYQYLVEGVTKKELIANRRETEKQLFRRAVIYSGLQLNQQGKPQCH